MRKVITSEKHSTEIKVFNFGISAVKEGFLVYLAGSKSYNEANEDWASYPPDFLAEELIVSESEVGEWDELLQEVIDFLTENLDRSSVQESFLGGAIPIYTGFIDGDLHRIK